MTSNPRRTRRTVARLGALVGTLLVAGCALTIPEGRTAADYDRDAAGCQAWANGHPPEWVSETMRRSPPVLPLGLAAPLWGVAIGAKQREYWRCMKALGY